MHRIFVASSDRAYCDKLLDCFQSQADFDVCGKARNGVEAIKKVASCLPDLILLETEIAPLTGFKVADAIKSSMPTVPMFLIAKEPITLIEKEAWNHGISAVFEKEDDLTSLLMNARAVCPYRKQNGARPSRTRL